MLEWKQHMERMNGWDSNEHNWTASQSCDTRSSSIVMIGVMLNSAARAVHEYSSAMSSVICHWYPKQLVHGLRCMSAMMWCQLKAVVSMVRSTLLKCHRNGRAVCCWVKSRWRNDEQRRQEQRPLCGCLRCLGSCLRRASRRVRRLANNSDLLEKSELGRAVGERD